MFNIKNNSITSKIIQTFLYSFAFIVFLFSIIYSAKLIYSSYHFPDSDVAYGSQSSVPFNFLFISEELIGEFDNDRYNFTFFPQLSSAGIFVIFVYSFAILIFFLFILFSFRKNSKFNNVISISTFIYILIIFIIFIVVISYITKTSSNIPTSVHTEEDLYVLTDSDSLLINFLTEGPAYAPIIISCIFLVPYVIFMCLKISSQMRFFSLKYSKLSLPELEKISSHYANISFHFLEKITIKKLIKNKKQNIAQKDIKRIIDKK